MKRLFFILCILYSFTFGFAQDEETLMNDFFRYLDAGQHEKVIELGPQLLSRMDEVEVENEEDKKDLEISKVGVLIVLGESYIALQYYDKAIELVAQAIEICKRELGEEHPFYETLLNNLACCYTYIGNYVKAIEIGTQVIEINRQVLKEPTSSYATSLDNLALSYFKYGDLAKAIELGTQAFEIFKRKSGEDQISFAHSLNNLATYYSAIGNYTKAIEFETQAWEIVNKHGVEEDRTLYVNILNNLAIIYSNLGKYTKAIELGTQALEFIKREPNENHLSYALSLHNLSVVHFHFGDYAKAIEQETLALKIRKSVLGENHPDYALSLSNLAFCYALIDDYAKAINLGTQVSKIYKHVLGENHPDYAMSLGNLSFYHLLNGNYLMAAMISGDAIRIEQDFLTQTLSCLSSTSRFTYWNKYQYNFQVFYPYLSCLCPTYQQLSDCYDKSCLFSKGLLLSANTELRKLILESGDKATIVKFNELLFTRSWLNTLYEKPIAERHVNTDSLEQVAELLETELVQQSKIYGDFMHNLKQTWRDVQAKLGDKDIAIEFLSFPMLNSDSTIYIALTVRPGYDSPHLVKLFEEHKLEDIKSSYYTNPELSKLLWGKMAGELEGVKNIYFSPSGELYNIAIESMPHWAESCMMSDRFNLYRLSSTRELAINRSKTKSSGAVIYGGIHFDTDVAHMGTPSRGDDDNYLTFSSFNLDSVFTRGTVWRYLQGTLVEANQVNAILKNAKKTQVKLISGENATETSFKQLSGQKKRILHIATHGFYWSESRAESEKEILRFLQMDGNHPRYVEDKAMTRSGLIFAGANNAFRGVNIPAGVDDGVLTAQEISQLDLRGLDLLVLSACKTGLGEIKGDGVFGLQRGFKKAGAQTIMMSLRAVDDKATKDMMIQFYKALTSGRTKHEAFIQAQQYLKDHDSEYTYNEHFPHWAAFILLDAI